jgi:TM2 domain-containing membrane protein YozV
MKKILIMFFVVCVAFTSQAASSDYYIDDNQVETVLEESVQVTFNAGEIQFENMMNASSVQASDPNPWVAFALAWVVGALGVHRVYLGGRGILILFYIITCFGIFGIVPLVDWVVLLVGAINDDISKYVNNDSFFMW